MDLDIKIMFMLALAITMRFENLRWNVLKFEGMKICDDIKVCPYALI